MRTLPYQKEFPPKSEKRNELWKKWEAGKEDQEDGMTWEEFLKAEATKPDLKAGDLVLIKLTKHQVRVSKIWYLPFSEHLSNIRGTPDTGCWYLAGTLERDGSWHGENRTVSRDGEEVKGIPVKVVERKL